MAETSILRSSSINRTPNTTGAKPQTQLSGSLPPVMVNMNNGGPSQNNGQQTVKQGVVLLPPKGARRTFQTGGLPNQPAKQGVVIMPPKDPKYAVAAAQRQQELSSDQLMLCRHLAAKHLAEAGPISGEARAEGGAVVDNVKIAETTIIAIDGMLADLTAAAAEAEAAAAAAAAAPVATRVPPQQRVNTGGPRSVQASTGVQPRRVARPGPPLPPVVVKMTNGEPVPVDPSEVNSAAAAKPTMPADLGTNAQV